MYGRQVAEAYPRVREERKRERKSGLENGVHTVVDNLVVTAYKKFSIDSDVTQLAGSDTTISLDVDNEVNLVIQAMTSQSDT